MPPWQYKSRVWIRDPFCSWYTQPTSRSWRPFPHVTEHWPHSPVTHLEREIDVERGRGERGRGRKIKRQREGK